MFVLGGGSFSIDIFEVQCSLGDFYRSSYLCGTVIADV